MGEQWLSLAATKEDSKTERPECAKAREKQGCKTPSSDLCTWLSTSEPEGGCDYKREVRLEGFSRVLKG